MDMTRQTVDEYRRQLRLNQRTRILQEFRSHIRMVGIHPLKRNLLFKVRNQMNVNQLRRALIRIVGNALKRNHLSRVSFKRRFAAAPPT